MRLVSVQHALIFCVYTFRSQMLNQADAIEKLRSAIRKALRPDKPVITSEEEEKFRYIGHPDS